MKSGEITVFFSSVCKSFDLMHSFHTMKSGEITAFFSSVCKSFDLMLSFHAMKSGEITVFFSSVCKVLIWCSVSTQWNQVKLRYFSPVFVKVLIWCSSFLKISHNQRSRVLLEWALFINASLVGVVLISLGLLGYVTRRSGSLSCWYEFLLRLVVVAFLNVALWSFWIIVIKYLFPVAKKLTIDPKER